MLKIVDLSISGKDNVSLLDHVNLSIAEKGCIGLTGSSGAGKSTIIKAIMGMLDPTCTITSGEILLNNESLLLMNKRVRRKLCGTTIGYIPQNPMNAFNRNRKIGKIMEETFCIRLDLDKNLARKLITQCLNKVNLIETERILGSTPAQLSGGMLQRITIAILLGLKPKYILADEPTSALDEDNSKMVIQLLKEYKKEVGVLFLSHDVTAIKSLCSDLMVLEKGQVLEENTVVKIFDSPEKKWTKLFVEASTLTKGGEFLWTKL
jgi:peptide/nickel transport system ATP-binding protein/nickel transport system ATP-binding protein